MPRGKAIWNANGGFVSVLLTHLLTFEPDPDHSPDAGTGLLSSISYKRCIRRILRRETTSRGFIHRAVERPFVGGTCVLPSALLVLLINLQGESSLT